MRLEVKKLCSDATKAAEKKVKAHQQAQEPDASEHTKLTAAKFSQAFWVVVEHVDRCIVKANSKGRKKLQKKRVHM